MLLLPRSVFDLSESQILSQLSFGSLWEFLINFNYYKMSLFCDEPKFEKYPEFCRFFTLFCKAFTRTLLVIDDREFHEEDKPFTKKQLVCGKKVLLTGVPL